ncbi:MAG TPA: AEC family transporter, partial [Ardenticatenaceae bacterium]|nr:AEC family transporter [Ardenticatenaceae bacterium]
MTVLLDVVLPVLLGAAIVFVAQPRLHLDARPLSRATFYFFSPALVFNSLATSDLSAGELGRVALAVFLVTLALWIVSALLVRLVRLEGAAGSAFLLATLFVNAGNYGLPVTLFAFGETGLAIASVYFAASSMMQSSLGVYLAARGNATARQAAAATFRVPLVYAALLGIALNLADIALPAWLAKSADLLGQGAIPIMLALLGIQLANLMGDRTQRTPALLRPLV